MKPDELTSVEIAYISLNIYCPYYKDNLVATRLMAEALADIFSPAYFRTYLDYIRTYNGNFFTFKSWQELVDSEKEEGEFALKEEQLKEQLGVTIFQMSNGWFLERV